MADFYDDMRSMAAEMLEEFKQGTVVLTRSTPGAVDPDHPEVFPVTTTETYELDATVSGVSAEYIDGTVVVASDEMALCSPIAKHTLTNGEAADSAKVDIEPEMADTVTVDGTVRTLRRIKRIPAAGTASAFILFIR